jgi:hypothetical protein
MMGRFSLCMLSMLVFFAACTKTTTPLSREEEIRGGRWKVLNGTVRLDPNVGKDTVYSFGNYTTPCKRDDYFVFLENYNAEQRPGDTACSPADAESIPFRWQLFDDDKGIYFLNATETFFGESTVKANFVNYYKGRFTIRYVKYLIDPVDITKADTLTFTTTYTKY